uniref:Breast cancer type 2 susceptibility protein-like n=1 Tax=Saccoglossus kowalevskii TaxID=10224 RepID=A0ABM0MQG0_SACKO|nr:PREDICTED: breast cancer type 2 susceptibility protein-like [Saccoglossus kowalevskii]
MESSRTCKTVPNIVDGAENADKTPAKGYVGFQTASGKGVTISEKAFKKAKSIFSEMEMKETTSKTYETVPDMIMYGAANGNRQSCVATNLLTDSENTEMMPASEGFVGFQTASGKGVKISESAIKRARSIFSEVEMEEKSNSIKKTFQDGMNTTDGSGQRNRQSCMNDELTKNLVGHSVDEMLPFTGFKTAGGKQVNICEKSLQRAAKFLADSENTEKIPVGEFVGFQTASGKDVKISEKALKKAKIIFSEVEMEETVSETCETVPDLYMDGAANGNSQTCVDVENMEHHSGMSKQNGNSLRPKNPSQTYKVLRDGNFTDDNVETGVVELGSFSGFQTAGGKTVEISDKAIFKARNFLADDSSSYRDDLPRVSSGFQTAKGDKVTISESSVLKAQMLLAGEQSLDLISQSNTSKVTSTEMMVNRLTEISADKTVPLKGTINPTKRRKTDDSNMLCKPRVAQKHGPNMAGTVESACMSTGNIEVSNVVARSSRINGNTVKNPSIGLCEDTSGVKVDCRGRITPVSTTPTGFTKDRHQKFSVPLRPIVSTPKNGIKSNVNSINSQYSPHGLFNYRSSTDKSTASTVSNQNKNCSGRSSFKTPFRKRVISVDSESGTKTVNEKSTPNIAVLPSQTIQPSINFKESNRKQQCSSWTSRAITAKQTYQAAKIKPAMGSLYTKRCNQPRLKLHDVVGSQPPQQHTPDELHSFGIHPSVLDIRSSNAENYRFNCANHYSTSICSNQDGIQLSDGGILVPDEKGTAGKDNFYIEKTSEGSSTVHSARAETKIAARFEQEKQKRAEKLFKKIQDEFEKSELSHDVGRNKQKGNQNLKIKEIAKLDTGEDIYEALQTCTDPMSIENYLNGRQFELLHSYKQSLIEKKHYDLQSEFQRALDEQSEEFPASRRVSAIYKVRITDYTENRNNTSCLLTVWRPNDDIIGLLSEGTRHKIFNLSTSAGRSKYRGSEIQLSSTRSSRYHPLPLENEVPMYLPRKILNLGDVYFQPMYGEVDIVGLVVFVSELAGGLQSVVVSDEKRNQFIIKFWNGVQAYHIEDMMKPSTFIAASNLQFRQNRHSQGPCAFASEYSVFTENPKATGIRMAFLELKAAIQDPKGFIQSMTNVGMTIDCFPVGKNTQLHIVRNESSDYGIQTRTLSPSVAVSSTASSVFYGMKYDCDIQSPITATSSRSYARLNVDSKKTVKTSDVFTEDNQSRSADNNSSSVTPNQTITGIKLNFRCQDFSSHFPQTNSPANYLDHIPSPPPIPPLPSPLPCAVRKCFKPPLRTSSNINPGTEGRPQSKCASLASSWEQSDKDEKSNIDTFKTSVKKMLPLNNFTEASLSHNLNSEQCEQLPMKNITCELTELDKQLSDSEANLTTVNDIGNDEKSAHSGKEECTESDAELKCKDTQDALLLLHLSNLDASLFLDSPPKRVTRSQTKKQPGT